MQNIQKYAFLKREFIIEFENDHRFGVKSIIFEKITKYMFFDPKSLAHPLEKVKNQNWVDFFFCNLGTSF